MVHDFVSKRSARADLVLATDLFSAEDALRRALTPLVDVSGTGLSFESRIRATAQASRAAGGFERTIDLTFNSLGEGATQLDVTAVASPPVDSTRRFRGYKVPRAARELLQTEMHELRSQLPEAVVPAPRDRVRFHSRFLSAPTDVTLHIPLARREAVAAAREALETLPAYGEATLSSSTGSIELPSRDGYRSLVAMLVQHEETTEISLFAGARPEAREALQRQLDRIVAELAATPAP